jgi:hypothetical protein
MNTKDYVRISPFWKVHIPFAGTMLIALVTFLYYLITWVSSSTSIAITGYAYHERIKAIFENTTLESLSYPETTWIQDVCLQWYHGLIPSAICFTAFLSVLFFLYLALQILVFHSPHIALEDGKEVIYVNRRAENWSSQLFKFSATVTLYSIVASALGFVIILTPYMGWLVELFRISLVTIKSLSMVPDGFNNHFELYIYMIVGIFFAASLLVATFHYHVLLYVVSRFLTKKLPGLSNVFRHLSQQDSATKRRKTVAQMVFYFKDFLRFSVMYLFYGLILFICFFLITYAIPICSIKISTDKPAYKIQIPSEKSSNDGFDDIGILTINLGGFVKGDVRVKIVPRNQYSHIIACETYKKLDYTNLINTGDTFGYRYYFPLKDISGLADNSFIVDVLVGKGLMEWDCLRFQESFNLIVRRSATDLEYNTRAEEAVEKAFQKMEEEVN